MTKRILACCFVILSIFTLASCSDQGASSKTSKSNAVADVLNQQKSSEAETQADSAGSNKISAKSGDAEIDLTKLGSNMVYSEVYHMISEPEKYVGKTVRMNGTMDIYEENGKTYYSCIIKDAAACCAQGFEFLLKNENYPKRDAKITVYGTFETYKEDRYTFCRLKDAKLES